MGSDDRDGDGDVPRFNPDRSSWLHNSSSYDLNSKLLLTAIASLAAVILLVFALHIYARCVFGRRNRNRNRNRSAFDLRSFVAQPPKRGLDPAVIASLPTIVIGHDRDDATSMSTAMECTVCLSGLEEDDTARILPNCKHVFHVDCIDVWLSTRSTCPICRAEAEPRLRLEPEPREGPIGGATAPPLEIMGEASTSIGGKIGGSGSRLNSFRRILTRERSSNRITRTQEDRVEDLEQQ